MAIFLSFPGRTPYAYTCIVPNPRSTGQYGQVFVVRPEARAKAPLDVETVDLGVTIGEIVQLVREARERYG